MCCRRPILGPHEPLLRELVDGKDITLAEIQGELSRRVGLAPDLATIHHHLRRLGLRRKKIAKSLRPGSARCRARVSDGRRFVLLVRRAQEHLALAARL